MCHGRCRYRSPVRQDRRRRGRVGAGGSRSRSGRRRGGSHGRAPGVALDRPAAYAGQPHGAALGGTAAAAAARCCSSTAVVASAALSFVVLRQRGVLGWAAGGGGATAVTAPTWWAVAGALLVLAALPLLAAALLERPRGTTGGRRLLRGGQGAGVGDASPAAARRHGHGGAAHLRSHTDEHRAAGPGRGSPAQRGRRRPGDVDARELRDRAGGPGRSDAPESGRRSPLGWRTRYRQPRGAGRRRCGWWWSARLPTNTSWR